MSTWVKLLGAACTTAAARAVIDAGRKALTSRNVFTKYILHKIIQQLYIWRLISATVVGNGNRSLSFCHHFSRRNIVCGKRLILRNAHAPTELISVSSPPFLVYMYIYLYLYIYTAHYFVGARLLRRGCYFNSPPKPPCIHNVWITVIRSLSLFRYSDLNTQGEPTIYIYIIAVYMIQLYWFNGGSQYRHKALHQLSQLAYSSLAVRSCMTRGRDAARI